MRFRSRSTALVVAIASVSIVATSLVASGFPQRRDEIRPRSPSPTLFEASIPCDSARGRNERAMHAEQRALALWEGYLYDPGDGVRAVQRLQLAHSCYVDADLPRDAGRVAAALERLVTRVESDYLTSKVSLESAVSSRDSSGLRRELPRLLALTAHRADHEYVRYLRSLAAEVAVDAQVGR